MFNHTEGCKFKDFYKSVTTYDPNGPDVELTVTEGGIEFSANIYTVNPGDFEIVFNFCPCCGVPRI